MKLLVVEDEAKTGDYVQQGLSEAGFVVDIARNGLDGPEARLVANSPLHVRHIENLANMAKTGLFVYKGRGNAADSTFVSGECAMITGSSALYGNIKRNAKFASGISTLPYYPDVPGAPQNTVIGGASLWVISGKKPEEYKGVAAFFDYLSKTEVQQYLHETSGYLPVTLAAYEATKASGFYDENPGREQPIIQMMGKPPTANSRGVRLVNLPQVRDIQNEEFEKMLAGEQTAQQALDNAVRRADESIQQALGN